MALGKRLVIEATDRMGGNTTMNIYLEGYTGAVAYREPSGDHLKIKWGTKGGQDLPNVYGSEADIEFYADVDYEFLDLFTANARDVYLEVIKNDTDLIWCGYHEPDKWGEPLISPKYPVQMTFFDGLGLLKDEDFTDDNGDPYEGEQTLLYILQLILSKTGLSLNINTKWALSENTLGDFSAFDHLPIIKKEMLTYEGKNCYEVLEQLFRSCRIFQRDGEWWIISNNQWSNSTISTFIYASDGTSLGTSSFNPRTTQSWWFVDQAKMDIVPALKQLTVKQDFGFIPNIIENGNFEDINSGSFDSWQATGTTPQQRVYDDKGNKYVYLTNGEAVPYASWDSYAFTKWLRSKQYRVYQTTNIPNISLSYALMGTKNKSCWMFFGVHLVGDSGTEYSLKATLNTDHEIEYTWQTTTDKLGIPCKSIVNEFKTGIFASKQWEVKPQNIEAYPYDEVGDHFADISISAKDGIPETGYLRIYLYLASTSDSAIAGACYRQVGLKFADANDEELPTDKELLLTNNAKNNYVPDDLELINGDIPDISNNVVIYRGGFLMADGTPTASWALDGSGSYPFVELMARMLASNMRQPRQAYDCKLGEMAPGTDMIISDSDNGNKLLLECGITYNDREKSIEGQYIEVLSTNLAFTIGEKINYTAGQTSSSGGTTKGVDTDEKVGFINDSYELVNQPGYLDSDEFIGILDENTGRIRILSRYKWLHHVEATGAINGTNKDFLLPYIPDPDSLYVWHNTTLLTSDKYSLSDDTVTMNEAPRAGTNYTDTLRFSFRYDQTQ